MRLLREQLPLQLMSHDLLMQSRLLIKLLHHSLELHILLPPMNTPQCGLNLKDQIRHQLNLRDIQRGK